MIFIIIIESRINHFQIADLLLIFIQSHQNSAIRLRLKLTQIIQMLKYSVNLRQNGFQIKKIGQWILKIYASFFLVLLQNTSHNFVISKHQKPSHCLSYNPKYWKFRFWSEHSSLSVIAATNVLDKMITFFWN
jgi:hypothetical protein